MLLRKPAVLLTSSNVLSSSLSSGTAHGQNSSPPCRCRHRRTNVRSYATVNQDTQSQPNIHIPWPDLGDSPIPPTPYQIFNQKPEEPYSKRRFYELVKLYHPDRHKHVDDSAASSNPLRRSPTIMIKRYRLVIAANTILSDPLKRKAYDRFGAGWDYREVADISQHENTGHKYSTFHRWRADGSAAYQWPTDQDPMYNATWEDWERWYRQQYEKNHKSSRWSSSYFSSGRPRNPLYASNHGFISAVFLLAALGGVGQATRVKDSNRWRMQRTQIMNDRASESLMQARQDTLERKEKGETRDQRIKRFLREHEDYEEGEFDGRALRQGDEGLCASGEIKDKDKPKFWERPPEINR